MDYESMSDFEINKRVAELMWPNFVNYEQFGRVRVQDPDGDDFYFDFNNPSDAWPIIMKNKITVGPEENDIWSAFDISVENIYDDKNPLRAAMIVFLMAGKEQE